VKTGFLPFQGEQISAPNKLGGWEFAGAVPAHGEAEYSALLPTLADSTTSGIHWSVFFVRAATAQPLVFFDSCADSGYSVDNLAPSVPTALFVAYAHDGNELTWEPCPDKDFRYFRIYRGPDDEFVPDPETLVKVTTGTDWLDPASNPWHHRYKVAAVDFAGNESAAAVPSGVSGTPDTPAIPQRFALHQCVPNPFNPLTRIRYELPQAAQVRLDVFSASGRLVATIVHAEQPPGSHEAVWEGRDTTGRVVAAGVYFYRLEAGSFVDTKRMLLLK